jgi:transposase-like protein
MARCAAAPVCVSTKHRRRLEAIVRQHHAPQSLVLRARIILMASDGVGVRETAGKFGVGRATLQRWRKRWRTNEGERFPERLCDGPRPGTPPTFQPEQICQIIALACEPPSASDRPFTHWTQGTLAAAARAMLFAQMVNEIEAAYHRLKPLHELVQSETKTAA